MSAISTNYTLLDINLRPKAEFTPYKRWVAWEAEDDDGVGTRNVQGCPLVIKYRCSLTESVERNGAAAIKKALSQQWICQPLLTPS